jgi:hypothetical protein
LRYPGYALSKGHNVERWREYVAKPLRSFEHTIVVGNEVTAILGGFGKVLSISGMLSRARISSKRGLNPAASLSLLCG